jgi:hypothetical protein
MHLPVSDLMPERRDLPLPGARIAMADAGPALAQKIAVQSQDGEMG